MRVAAATSYMCSNQTWLNNNWHQQLYLAILNFVAHFQMATNTQKMNRLNNNKHRSLRAVLGYICYAYKNEKSHIISQLNSQFNSHIFNRCAALQSSRIYGAERDAFVSNYEFVIFHSSSNWHDRGGSMRASLCALCRGVCVRFVQFFFLSLFHIDAIGLIALLWPTLNCVLRLNLISQEFSSPIESECNLQH